MASPASWLLPGSVWRCPCSLLTAGANRYVDEGLDPHAAALRAGIRRFRPIVLAALATFFGLAPMIFETSIPARFLIPMAISLGFGIVFSTAIILLLTPALHVIQADLTRLRRRLLTPRKARAAKPNPAEPTS